MPLNGAGTYALPTPEYPAIPDTTILASDWNTVLEDLQATLSLAIYKDGQSSMEADLGMGSFVLTGLGDGVNPADSVNFNQVFVSPTFTDPTLSGTTVTIDGTALVVTSTTASFIGVDVTVDTQLPTDDSTKIASTAFVQDVAMNAALPSQTGKANKHLITNGTTADWEYISAIYIDVDAQGFKLTNVGNASASGDVVNLNLAHAIALYF